MLGGRIPDAPHFAAIDFETANTSRDSACSVGIAVAKGGRIIALETRLIRPPSRYFKFTYIHGLTWDDVRQAPAFDSVWRDVSPLVSGVDFLAAHNASFDRSVLRACCARYGLNLPSKRFECSMRLARDQWRIYPTKLSDVCRSLRIPLNHHEAGSDAQACAQIVLAAVEKGWQWKRRTPHAASQRRRRARRSWYG